jgi:hypothetical protein
LASPALVDIASAFRRRAKALAHKTSTFELAQETDADGHERLNVDANVRGTQVRVSFWDDRSLWYRACHPGPSRSGGWEFMLAFSGEVGDSKPDDLVEMFERSLGCAHGRDSTQHCNEILAVWSRVGPSVERGAGSR